MSTLNNTIAAGISFLPAQAAARKAEGGEDVNEGDGLHERTREKK
jgi:hypothetical protein